MKKIEMLLFTKTIEIVKNIATGNYTKLKNDGCLNIITKDDILSILDEYGGDVSMVDEKHGGRFRFVQCKEANMYITFADMIIDSNVSDLTLICEIRISDEMNGIESAVIEDLHVL